MEQGFVIFYANPVIAQFSNVEAQKCQMITSQYLRTIWLERTHKVTSSGCYVLWVCSHTIASWNSSHENWWQVHAGTWGASNRLVVNDVTDGSGIWLWVGVPCSTTTGSHPISCITRYESFDGCVGSKKGNHILLQFRLLRSNFGHCPHADVRGFCFYLEGLRWMAIR